jgi:RNA polymerase sigma factor (sigma-70 family)
LSGFGFRRVYGSKEKMTDGHTLLSLHARTGSESAFRELVTRCLDLVYSTAFRLVGGDAQSAQDATQTVFLALADKARTLPKDVMLGGWLHEHTRFVAGKIMRAERRRQMRERQVAEMNAIEDHTESNLAEVAPVLDDAIGQLDTEDRAAILLRVFERKDFRSVGEAIGSSEDAARKVWTVPWRSCTSCWPSFPLSKGSLWRTSSNSTIAIRTTPFGSSSKPVPFYEPASQTPCSGVIS